VAKINNFGNLFWEIKKCISNTFLQS
jgi:hypothetical protein